MSDVERLNAEYQAALKEVRRTRGDLHAMSRATLLDRQLKKARQAEAEQRLATAADDDAGLSQLARTVRIGHPTDVSVQELCKKIMARITV